MLKRFLFFIVFLITIAILIVPVVISMLIWVFSGKGLMWIVRTMDWMLSTHKMESYAVQK